MHGHLTFLNTDDRTDPQVIESDDEDGGPGPAAPVEPMEPEEPQKEVSPPAAPPAPAPAPRTPSPPPPAASTFDMEADISMLEPATFTTINRGPPEPMLRLSWNHKVSVWSLDPGDGAVRKKGQGCLDGLQIVWGRRVIAEC